MLELLSKNTISSDEDLVRKVVAGEIALFELLIRRHNPVLYKIARSYGFNHQDAQDLVQEAHISAYQHLAQFAFKASYKTWISKIIIHKCLYKLNHGYGKNERPASNMISEDANPVLANTHQANPEENSINREFALVLEEALQKLPLHYRSVFVLRQVEGFSVAETADMLGITQVNVKVRLNRAKALLQSALEQYYQSAGIYEFHLQYCDKVVDFVFSKIGSS